MAATVAPIGAATEMASRTIGSTTVVISTADSHGERLLMEMRLPRHSRGSRPLHFHPRQSERFEVLEGELHVLVGTERLVLGPGETAVVPAKTNHCFYTVDSVADLPVELRPAGTFERGMRIVEGLGPALGRNLLLIALIIQEFEVLFPRIPLTAQRMLIASLAALARRLYRRRLAPYDV